MGFTLESTVLLGAPPFTVQALTAALRECLASILLWDYPGKQATQFSTLMDIALRKLSWKCR